MNDVRAREKENMCRHMRTHAGTCSRILTARALAQGFLKFMGLGELIADSIEDMVQLALKIGLDRSYRDRLSAVRHSK